MADKRISQLVERTDIANNDVVPIVASGATTTNKATISSIQTFMQENLDVGVTSVGITLGSSGNDVSVTGSPITTSGNITINIPTASASARGLVSTGIQTFAGIKTFNNTIIANDDIGLVQVGTALPTYIKNISGTFLTAIGSNGIGFNGANNIYFAGSNKLGGVIAWNNTGNRIYTLPDETGTIALTSNLTGFVPYTGANAPVDLGTQPLSASQININGTAPTSGSYLGFKHATTVTTGASGYTSMYTFGTNIIAFKSVSGATNKDFSFDMSTITSNVSGGRIYSLPDSNGMLALTTMLTDFVTLNTAQTITAQKTFTTSGGADTLIVDHTSGSGIAVDISKAGNGEGLRVAKTSGTGNAVTITGGLLSAEAATLTGALNGTSASFSGSVSGLSGTFQEVTTTGTTDAFYNANRDTSSYANGLRLRTSTNNNWLIGTAGATTNLIFYNYDLATSPLTLSYSTGAATFSSSVTAQVTNISADGVGVVLQGYIDNTLRIAVRGSGYNDGARGGLFASSGDFSTTLNVAGAATFSSSVNLGTNANAADTSALNIKQAGTSYNQGIYIERGGERNGYHMYIGGALDSLTFRRNYFGTQSDVMSLTRDGNVGIGTASPNIYNLTNTANLTLSTTTANYAVITAAGSAGNGGEIDFGNQTIRHAAIASLNGSNLGFYTNGSNSGTGVTERMLIRNDGLVFMNGLISSFTTGSAANMFVSAGDGAIYRSTSSIKYKKNVEDYSKGLAEVLQMRPVFYEGISETDEGKTFAGLIAEEVHDLGLTEFVQYAEDGSPDSLAYQNMVSLLIKAIQELKTEIDSLKNQMQ